MRNRNFFEIFRELGYWKCFYLIENRGKLLMLKYFSGSRWGEPLSSLSKSHPSSLLSPPVSPSSQKHWAWKRRPSLLCEHRLPPLSRWPWGTEVSLRYITTCPGPSCLFSGNAELCFFSCFYILPWVSLNYQQTVDNLAKILGKNLNIRFASWVSILQCCPTFGIPVCPEQHALSFPAEQKFLCWRTVLSSGTVLYLVLRAGTTAMLCNVLICNSLTYASYNDTLGFGKTALLIYMGDNTPDDCYERDLRHLI